MKLTVLGLLALLGLSTGGSHGASGDLKPGDPAPTFKLTGSDGKTCDLASFKGKVILLDFWATWCGPCKVEIPHFIEFHNKYGAKGLQIVGIFRQGPLPDDEMAFMRVYGDAVHRAAGWFM